MLLMTKTRFRIKRLLGLNRGTTTVRKHLGGIESLMPGRISGWTISNAIPFHEVRLLVGTNLIARVEINQERQDVCEIHNYDGNPGFSLAIPSSLPPIDWDEPIRLLAISSDGSHQADLKLLDQPHNTSQRILDLLQSQALGFEGHFDGIVKGALQGWAASRDQHESALIWLQANGQEPIPVICDQLREGMEKLQLPNRCGFRLPLENLPEPWKGLPIRCTFDQDGLLPLPQTHAVYLPLEPTIEVLQSPRTDVEDFHVSLTTHSVASLNNHWEELELFQVILDEVESQLNKRDAQISSRKSQSRLRSWMHGLIGMR
jgi:hypothetical protein